LFSRESILTVWRLSTAIRTERMPEETNDHMAASDLQIRDGITFEWIDDPSTPNPRWRARMSRQVFAALVKEKLGTDRGDSCPAPRRRKQNALP
jgi:hypothetical protein